jgi:glycosyltransferase involved in cell wall biosynthesis
MKVALVADQILTSGGSERVFLTMVQEFREADVFSLSYNPATSPPGFQDFRIRTTGLGRAIRTHARFKTLYPLATLAMERIDLRGYVVVLTSSATVAKHVTRLDGTHICYCYYPTRAIWTPDAYFGDARSLKMAAFRAAHPLLKRRDYAAAQRVDHFIAISHASRAAIQEYYHRDADVLHCPIDFVRFVRGSAEAKGEHYLIVSRLEYWKRVDYAIAAFNQLGRKLRIVGTGPDEARLRAMAGPTVEFVGRLDDDALTLEYGRARAVIFTPELEYGLVPLEANAAGTPVIALGRRGVTETMRPVGLAGTSHGEPATAVFYHEQTAEALIEAVRQFENATFDRSELVRHAETFGTAHFQRKLRRMVDEILARPRRTARPRG